MPGPQDPHEPLQGQCLDCHLADGETEARRDELTCPGPTDQLASVVLHSCMPTGIIGCHGQEVVTDSASPCIRHALPKSLGPPEDNSALQKSVGALLLRALRLAITFISSGVIFTAGTYFLCQ